MDIKDLIIVRCPQVLFKSIDDDSLLARLKSNDTPTLEVTSNANEVNDAFGNLIDTIYNAKKGKFSATHTYLSLDLMGLQFGADKEVASATKTIPVPSIEIATVADGKITLKHKPNSELRYIHKLVNNDPAIKYELDSTTADAEHFTINEKEVTVPTSVKNGDKIFVEYEYNAEEAVQISNTVDAFPQTIKTIIQVICKNVCDKKLYLGYVIAEKGMLDATSYSFALKGGGESNHPFVVNFNTDVCDENGELFRFVLVPDEE